MEIDDKALARGPMIHFGPADAQGYINKRSWGMSLGASGHFIIWFCRRGYAPVGTDFTPPLLGVRPTKRTRMDRFLVVDMPSAYNLILRRPALDTFQAVISTYHRKLKFSVGDNKGEVKGDHYTTWKCYIETIKSYSNNMDVDTPSKESSRRIKTVRSPPVSSQ
ncbi:UNVERIFIED_CONTAM: hypothetical protein Sradi_3321200 [Sesamum radiatum]|uniref:Uncharacterized protein n=1 Tax=Sesamum radiatum TaxID=300843 RepID=A0AAW2R1F7_SESRA